MRCPEGCCVALTGIRHDSAWLSTPWESYPPNSGSYQHIRVDQLSEPLALPVRGEPVEPFFSGGTLRQAQGERGNRSASHKIRWPQIRWPLGED